MSLPVTHYLSLFVAACLCPSLFLCVLQLRQYKVASSSMTFSTLDIPKGTDLDSNSDGEGEEADRHNDLDLGLTSGARKVAHNGATASPKQLTSMQMDAEYEPL